VALVVALVTEEAIIGVPVDTEGTIVEVPVDTEGAIVEVSVGAAADCVGPAIVEMDVELDRIQDVSTNPTIGWYVIVIKFEIIIAPWSPQFC